ncbi:hypothetical protein IAD21_01971 [Abditibacteriota bacterium]|nr:hypothetical protein IAD21_01971 [Abditibacteriota bacterium]
MIDNLFASARLPLMEPAQAGVWPQAPKPPLQWSEHEQIRLSMIICLGEYLRLHIVG